MSAYSQASDAVFEVFDDTTPVVEPVSVDEAFLDVWRTVRVVGTPVEIAAKLRARSATGSDCPSVSGCPDQIPRQGRQRVAKPDGLLLVPPDHELIPSATAGAQALGVGDVTAEKLHAHGIETVADVAELGESTLGSWSAGRWAVGCLRCRATSMQRRVVTGVRGGRSVLNGHWPGGQHDSRRRSTRVVNLVDRITRRMRKAGRTGRTVVLRMRFDDFGRATRSQPCHAPPLNGRHARPRRATWSSGRAPLIAERGLTLSGSRWRTSTGTALSNRVPFEDFGHPWRSTPPLTGPAALRHRRATRGVLLAGI